MAIQPLATNDFQNYLAGETPSKKMESENRMPSKFLEFYSAIIQYCIKYQEATKNLLEPMALDLDIAISKHIAKYFNRSEEEFAKIKDELNKSTSKIKELSEALKNRKLASDDDIEKAINNIVEEHRSSISDIANGMLQDRGIALIRKTYDRIKEKEKSDSTDSTSTDSLSSVTLQDKDIEDISNRYTKQVEAFSLRVGNNVLSRFQSFAEKTLGAVKYFSTSINKLVSYIGKNSAYGVLGGKEAIDAAKVLGDKVQEIEKNAKEEEEALDREVEASALRTNNRILSKIKTFLSWTGVGLFRMWVNRKFWVKASLFMALNTVLGVGFFHTLGIWIAFPYAFRLVRNVWNRTVRLFTGVFDFSKKIYDKVFKNSISKFFYTALRGFFSTYAGAFALGWMFGAIWFGVKKLFNWAAVEKDQETGMTRFQEMEAKMAILEENIRNKYKEYENKPKELLERFRSTWFYKASMFLAKTGWKLFKGAAHIVEKYVIPALPAIGYFLSMITGRDVRNFGMARIGYLRGLRALKNLSVKVKIRGGLIGAALAALVIGSGIAWHSYEKDKLSQNKAHIEAFKTNEFSLLEGLGPEILHGGLRLDEGIVSDILKQFKSDEAMRKKVNYLFDVSDELEKKFDDYNTFVEMYSDEFADSIDGNDWSKAGNIPVEVIRSIFTINGVPQEQLIKTALGYSKRDKLLFIRAFLETQLSHLNNSFKLVKEFVDSGNKDGLLNLDFKSQFYDIESISHRIKELREEGEKNRSSKNEKIFNFNVSVNRKQVGPSDAKKYENVGEIYKNTRLLKALGGKTYGPSGFAWDNAYEEQRSLFRKIQENGVAVINSEAEFDTLPLFERYLYSIDAFELAGNYKLDKNKKKKVKKEYEDFLDEDIERKKAVISDPKNWLGINFKDSNLDFYSKLSIILKLLSSSILSNINSVIGTDISQTKKLDLFMSFGEIVNQIFNSKNITDFSSTKENLLKNAQEILVDSVKAIKNRYKNDEAIDRALDIAFNDVDQTIADVIRENDNSINIVIEKQVDDLKALIEELDKAISTKLNAQT